MLEPPDPLGLGESMVAFHRALQFSLAGSSLETCLPVQRIEFEEVTARASFGWAWPIVANLAEIIPTLARPVPKLAILRDILL